MNLIFPLKQALNTPLGDVLIFLAIGLLAASSLYLYFWLRFARQKDLTKCHHLQFKDTEKQLKNIEFKGLASSDFFGKRQVASLPSGQFGQSLIFYPELSSREVSQRFQDYHMLLQKLGQPYFPKNQIFYENNQIACVETQFMQTNGETLINFAKYSTNQVLSDAEKERFLIDIAYMLEALHQVQTESGESLYHGFLLPSSFYFSINLVKKITNIYVSDFGCAFALGAQSFQKWLLDLFQGKYIVDASVKRHIFEFAFIFSPEQKLKGASITSATDFYSYAALAVFLFTDQAFESAEEINWELVPKGWRLFLKECLLEDPEKRPHNFLELREYLSDPEFEIESADSFKLGSSQDTVSIKSLKECFDKAQEDRQSSIELDESWHKGFLAVKEGDWERAHEIFSSLLNDQKKAFDGNLGLALLFYQQGDKSKAKEHYQEAKKIDAKRISYFHKLIAFDI